MPYFPPQKNDRDYILATAECSTLLGPFGLLDREVGVYFRLLLGRSPVVMKGNDFGRGGEVFVTRGYYTNLVELRGRTIPPTCGQNGGSFRPLLRLGADSPNNEPKKKKKKKHVRFFRIGCGHLASASELS